jgi:uncharacterized membrane protein
MHFAAQAVFGKVARETGFAWGLGMPVMSEVTAPVPTSAGSPATGRRPVSILPRLEAVDLLRGVVMVLMALDHTRDFLSAARFSPLDLSRTDPALFLTRWVTHFCAPVFVFLAGTGAFLSGARGKTRAQLAWFLLTRGLWLVVLEFTLVRLGWYFTLEYSRLNGQVIWVIGCSMVALAGLVFLPAWAVGALGVVLIACHNLFDGVRADSLGPFRWLWVALRSGYFSGGSLEPWPGVYLFVSYPVLPWLGVMAAGYGLGQVWLLDRGPRRRWLLGQGAGLTLLFVALRAVNRYGDPSPWSEQPSGLFTFFSFINCSKYPPSLLFLLMTLGPALFALGLLDRPPGPLGRVFVTFGRVPLFFYLLHLPLIHLVALGLARLRYEDVAFMFGNVAFAGPAQLPPGYGYGLLAVYLIWLGVVGLLYPVCRWFSGVKARRRSPWLSYL